MSQKETKQVALFGSAEGNSGPVTCLGMTFVNDAERRAYFTGKLRERLPELRKVEGFPIGEDEEILALSDPPYYTACPNPFMEEIVSMWQEARDNSQYRKEPFTADVLEGKTNPIYNVHSYHTKVPHKAIMRYILHYTEPKDIVLDGFAGTGMTGVAAQMCNDRSVLQSMGYIVMDDGTILDGNSQQPVSKVGERRVILSDLSPIATFISSNFNAVRNLNSFLDDMDSIIDELNRDFSWMYATQHVVNGVTQYDQFGKPVYGRINYTIWSDIFLCSNCSTEIIYWNSAVDRDVAEVKDMFQCPSCSVELKRQALERVWITKFDSLLNETIRHAKQIPVEINYTVGKTTFKKSPDRYDFEVLNEIETMNIQYWVPINRLPEGYNTSQPLKSHGFSHVHHFYTKRNLYVLAALRKLMVERNNPTLLFLFSSMVNRATQMNRIHLKNYFYGGGGCNAGYLKGTLYVSSLPIETSVLEQVSDRLKGVLRGLKELKNSSDLCVVNTGSTTKLSIKGNSVDYIFTDPPFGGNLMYSELNAIWESWLGVFTNNSQEAIVNSVQRKTISEYQSLMENCFKEYYRILKPGRWMTVEFSNSQASVWNAIQEALQRAGFIIANVSALDKKQGSFKAVTTTTAVKQDLIISVYKPSDSMIATINREQGTELSAWTFVQNHLLKLPVFSGKKGKSELVIERTPRVLFDRMVAFHVQNGFDVPISSPEFQAGIYQRFPIRDGMVFLNEQVVEYDRKRLLAKEFVQMSLFVSDENSAIEWLRQQLMKKPQTYQELQPSFMKEIQHIAKHEMLPELYELLEQNFFQYESVGPVPSQIHSYLSKNFKDLRELDKEHPALKAKAKGRWYIPDPNKQADLEKLREKALLREFIAYVEEMERSKKKLKQFRMEAIRAGFKKAWGEKDYKTIVQVGERLPENILQQDDKLLMYFDNAQTRLGM